MYCMTCGAQIPDRSKFCPKCGAVCPAVRPEPASVPQNQAPAQSPFPPHAPAPGQAPVYAQTPPPPGASPAGQPENGGPAPKKKSLLWLWLTLGGVALVAAGLVLFFVLRGGSDAPADPTGTAADPSLTGVATKSETEPDPVGSLSQPYTEPTETTGPLSTEPVPEGRFWLCESWTEYDADGSVVSGGQVSPGGNGTWTYSMHDAGGGDLGVTMDTYTDDGDLLERVYYMPDGTVGYSCRYEYDADGNVVYYAETDEDGEQTAERYVYDRDGNLTLYESLLADGTCEWKEEYRYENGEHLSTVWTYPEEDGMEITQISYYENDLETVWYYYENDELTYMEAYTYDDNGNPLLTVSTPSDGEVWTTEYVNSYDSLGRLAKVEEYEDGERLQYSTVYEYQSDGGSKKTVSRADGSVATIIGCDAEGSMVLYYEYDEDGTLTDFDECAYDEDGNETFRHTLTEWYEYTYDAHGNMTVSIEKDPDTGAVLSRTEYTYMSVG